MIVLAVSSKARERPRFTVPLSGTEHTASYRTSTIFCGILYCADCGFKMRSSTQKATRKNGNEYVHTNFQCGTYSHSSKHACTPHTIGEEALNTLVAEQIWAHARMVDCDEARMIERILRLQNDETVSSRAACAGELQTHRNRLAMLDKLIEKLYEDRVTGTVPETAFKNMIQKYEQERIDRLQSAAHLENRIQSIRQNLRSFAPWTAAIDAPTLGFSANTSFIPSPLLSLFFEFKKAR